MNCGAWNLLHGFEISMFYFDKQTTKFYTYTHSTVHIAFLRENQLQLNDANNSSSQRFYFKNYENVKQSLWNLEENYENVKTITLEFGRRLGTSAAEEPDKFQSDTCKQFYLSIRVRDFVRSEMWEIILINQGYDVSLIGSWEIGRIESKTLFMTAVFIFIIAIMLNTLRLKWPVFCKLFFWMKIALFWYKFHWN